MMFLRLGISNNFNFHCNLKYQFNTIRHFIRSLPNKTNWNKKKFQDVDSLPTILKLYQ